MKTTFATFAAAALVATFAIAGATKNAEAQDATFLSQEASHCEIFRALSRVVPGECTRAYQATRALVRHDQNLPEPQPTVQADPPENLSVAMMVNFELNSARLTAQSQAALDTIASVLGDRLLEESAILIEGHADGSGTETYNQTLSEQRAQAVRSYLVERHGIGADRLFAFGRGELEPYDPSNPYASVNRRVEFANVSG